MNANITGVKTVRLINEDGKQLGIVEFQEALKRAREAGLDLIEIAPNAKPPVVRVFDFKKFKYEEAKKERLTRKKTREIETKEIWLGPLISNHDLATRIEQARRFLMQGDRVKLTVRFTGREMAHPEFGYKVLEEATNLLADTAEPDSETRFIGRNLTLSLRPT